MYLLCFLLFLLLLSCKKETIQPNNKERESILLNGAQYKLWRISTLGCVSLPTEYFYFDDRNKILKLQYDHQTAQFKVKQNGRGRWKVFTDSTVVIEEEEYISRSIKEDVVFLIAKNGKDTIKLENLKLPELIREPFLPQTIKESQIIEIREKNHRSHKRLIKSSDLLGGCEYKIWKYGWDYPFNNVYLYVDNQGIYANISFKRNFNFYQYSSDSYHNYPSIWYQFGTTVFFHGNPLFTVYPQRGDTLPVVYVGEKDTTYFFDQLGFYDPPKKSWLQKLGLKE